MADERGVPAWLRWRCRRGMRELDALFGAWLEDHWAQADPELRDAFAQILALEDDVLWGWLSGREPPSEPYLRLIAMMRRDEPLH